MSFEDRLRDSFQKASRSMPDVPVPWELTITRARRARTRRTLSLAAAAVVGASGIAWAATTLGASTERALPPAQPIEEASPTPERTAERDDEMSRAVRTRVLDWVKALALGDAETAWSFMSPRSQAHFDNDLATFQSEMSALSEGFGSWYAADPPPETTLRVLASSGDGIAGIVEIHGIVTKEGTEELGHDALPVRIVEGEVLVEPFSSTVELRPKEPSYNESYPADELPALFRVTGEGEIQQANFFYDGMEPDMGHSISEGRGKTFEANSSAPHGIEPGPHFSTVAVVDDTGGIAVLVVAFFVE